MWVPQAHKSVQASGDQHGVLPAKVKCLDSFVNAEYSLVMWRPELRRPAQLDLFDLPFIAGLPDLSQPLLRIR